MFVLPACPREVTGEALSASSCPRSFPSTSPVRLMATTAQRGYLFTHGFVSNAGFHSNFFPEFILPMWVNLFGQYVLPRHEVLKLGLPALGNVKRCVWGTAHELR